jgi:hypothetical protein
MNPFDNVCISRTIKMLLQNPKSFIKAFYLWVKYFTSRSNPTLLLQMYIQTYNNGYHVGFSMPRKCPCPLPRNTSNPCFVGVPLQNCSSKLERILATPRRVSCFLKILKVQSSSRPQFQSGLKQFHIKGRFLVQQHKKLPTSLQGLQKD